jgi:tetratricopeptide (TPR) repeat protein
MNIGSRCVIAGFLLLPGVLASAQDRTALMSQAALREDWNRVAELATPPDALSPVERLLLGHAQLALNRNNESMANFLSVLTPDGSADQLGQWLEWTHSLRESSPTSAIACYFEGDALARLQRWPEAIQAFDAGLKLAPRHALLLDARGVSHSATWQMESALKDLYEATRANPRLADAWQSLGSHFVQRQHGADGAKSSLDKAVVLSPDSVVALTLRSGVLLVQEKPHEALADADRASKQVGPLSIAVYARVRNMEEMIKHPAGNETQLAQAAGDNPGMYLNRTTISAPASTNPFPSIDSTPPDLGMGARYSMAIGLRSSASSAGGTVGSFVPNQGLTSNLSQFSARVDQITTFANRADDLGSFLPESYQKGLDPFTSRAQTGGAIGSAFLGDLGQASQSGNFNPLQSRLLEQFGKTGLAALLPVTSDLHNAGLLSQAWVDHMPLLSPIGDITAGLAARDPSGVASGIHALDVANFARMYSGEALANLPASSLLGYGARFGATAALPDLMSFAGSRWGGPLTAPVTVSQATSLLDGIAKGTAFTATFLATGGNTKMGDAAATFSGLAATKGREWSMPWFQQTFAPVDPRQMNLEYKTYSTSQIAHGQIPLSQADWALGPGGARDGTANSETLKWSRVYQSTFNGAAENAKIQNSPEFNPRPSSFSQSPSYAPPLQPISPPLLVHTAPLVQPIPVSRPDMASALRDLGEVVGSAVGSGSSAGMRTPTTFTPMASPSVLRNGQGTLPASMYTPPPQTPTISHSTINDFANMVGSSVGGPSTPPTKPGGVEGGIPAMKFPDGRWPLTPWYGLGYVLNDQPAEKISEVQQ